MQVDIDTSNQYHNTEKKRIWDIHSHILPGIDDGASDMEESLEMLRQASAQGITDVIATPHYSHRYRNACPDRIMDLCRKLQKMADEELDTPVCIRAGQEIMYTEETAVLLREGRLLTLADSRYVLVEFLPSVPYSYIYQAVRELTMNGYVPVLAHAERYACLREAERMQEIRGQGGRIQLNTRSIGGKWYDSTARWCRKMLMDGQADYVGTDMHNTGSRKPETGQAFRWMQSRLTRRQLRRILCLNPEQMLRKD